MKKGIFYLVLIASLFSMQRTWAQEVECTKDSREKWMKPEEMQIKARAKGYKIKKFMTLEYCYQITATLNGKEVVHYFNPVDGSQVQTKK